MILKKTIDNRFVYFWNDTAKQWEGLKQNASDMTFERASAVMHRFKFKQDEIKCLGGICAKHTYTIEPL